MAWWLVTSRLRAAQTPTTTRALVTREPCFEEEEELARRKMALMVQLASLLLVRTHNLAPPILNLLASG